MIGIIAERRAAKKAGIVAQAWALASEEGIGGISLRALAARAGMRQPSLYEYFDSKLDLYDAMFADGNRQLVERLGSLDLPAEPRAAVKAFMGAFVSFALEDQARLQLLLQRPIPGFEPSPESYALAQDVLTRSVALLHAAGMTDAGDVDCFVAMVGGIIAAQASNEPTSDRWTRHLDRLIDLYLDHTTEGTSR